MVVSAKDVALDGDDPESLKMVEIGSTFTREWVSVKQRDDELGPEAQPRPDCQLSRVVRNLEERSRQYRSLRRVSASSVRGGLINQSHQDWERGMHTTVSTAKYFFLTLFAPSEFLHPLACFPASTNYIFNFCKSMHCPISVGRRLADPKCMYFEVRRFGVEGSALWVSPLRRGSSEGW